jgi:uncharacterized membrane protein YbhN (UPF0104 family)
MWLRESLRWLGGVALGGGLLWWVLRGTDPSALASQLRAASVPGLFLAAALGLAHNLFRVLRWRALLQPVRRDIPFRPMFDAVMLGYTVSWVIPGRLGEVVRPALLAGKVRMPLGPCLGSVLADRLLDGVAVLVLFAMGMLTTPLTGEAAERAAVVRGGALGLVALISIPIAVLLVASGGRARIERALVGRRGVRGWVGRMVLSLSQGVRALGRPALLLRVVLHTALAWGMILASTWVGIRSCGVPITLGGTMVLLPLLVLGIALPTPGGAGGYHAAMRVGLIQLFGVAQPLAVGAGLMQHAVIVLPVITVGVLILVVDRIPIQDLLHAARQVRDLGSPDEAAVPPGRPAEKVP